LTDLLGEEEGANEFSSRTESCEITIVSVYISLLKQFVMPSSTARTYPACLELRRFHIAVLQNHTGKTEAQSLALSNV
jgi:hypothetical protein